MCTARKEGLKVTRTGRGEIDVEHLGPPHADAVIATRDEDGGSTRTKYFEQGTHSIHIFRREVLLFDTIRYQTDCMRVVRLVISESEPLVNSVIGAWGLDLVPFGHQWPTGAPVEGDRDRVRYCRCELGKHVCPIGVVALWYGFVYFPPGNGLVGVAGQKLAHEICLVH